MPKRYYTCGLAATTCYYQFDGVDEDITVGTFSSFNFVHQTANFGISFWIRFPDYTVSQNGRIMNTDRTQSALQGFHVGWRNTSAQRRLRFRMTNGSIQNILSETTDDAITDNDWHHVLITSNATNVYFFIDGVKQTGSGTYSGALGGSNHGVPLSFASIPFFNFYTELDLDEVSFYNALVSDADAAIIFAEGRTNPDYSSIASLYEHYRMGEGDTWDGSDWTVEGIVNNIDGVSTNMEESDRVCS